MSHDGKPRSPESEPEEKPRPPRQRNEKGQWVKGVSGNPQGRPPYKNWIRALNDAVRRFEKRSGTDFMFVVLTVAIDQARKGKPELLRHLVDRLLGVTEKRLFNVNVAVGGGWPPPEYLQQIIEERRKLYNALNEQLPDVWRRIDRLPPPSTS